MSKLTDFVSSKFALARAIIGGETLTIGDGPALSVVFNELTRTRSLETGGWDQEITLSAVARLSDWSESYPLGIASYFGKTATARGDTFRIGTIRAGQSFVTLELVSLKKGT